MCCLIGITSSADFGVLKRAPLHCAHSRPARAYRRHASSAPYWGTDFLRPSVIKIGGFEWNAKNSVQFSIHPVRKKATSELSNGVQLSKAEIATACFAGLAMTVVSNNNRKWTTTQAKSGFFRVLLNSIGFCIFDRIYRIMQDRFKKLVNPV